MHSHGAFQELREQRLSAAAAEEQQQRERREREVIKRKENCSANASPEVKQILNVSKPNYSIICILCTKHTYLHAVLLCVCVCTCINSGDKNDSMTIFFFCVFIFALQNFLINRKQAASSNGITTTSPYRNRYIVYKQTIHN